MGFPKLYAIADAGVLQARGVGLREFAGQLRSAGVSLVQLRDKLGSPEEILAAAAILRDAIPAATLIMNDRADLAVLARFDGVHVGQDDLRVPDVRKVLVGIAGVSTHSDDQVRLADAAEPVVGLEGVRRLRALTRRPLVAIGGITRTNCRSVIEAGADSVAIISALFAPNETVEQVARDFLRILN